MRATRRLEASLRRVWASLTGRERERLLGHWRRHGPAVAMLAPLEPGLAGLCVDDGREFLFNGAHVAGLRDEHVDALVAHEVGHAMQSALGEMRSGYRAEVGADAFVLRHGFDLFGYASEIGRRAGLTFDEVMRGWYADACDGDDGDE